MADFGNTDILNGAYITGAMTSDGYNWELVPMTSEGGTVYSSVFSMLPQSSGAYYLANANDWTSRETVPLTCAQFYGSDRGYFIGTSDTTIYVTWNQCATILDCHGEVNGKASIDACGTCSGGNTGIAPCMTQVLSLSTGWNLVSLYVEAPEMSVKAIFPNARIVKTNDSFWSSQQPVYLNSLSTIVAGRGYLVNNPVSELVHLTGYPAKTEPVVLQLGWNLIGTPYAEPKPMNEFFGSEEQNVLKMKNLNSIWEKGNPVTEHSIEQGNAYYIFK